MSDKTTRSGDVEFIEALAKLLDDSGLTEIEVDREYGEADRLSVRVARQIESTVVSAPMAPAATAVVAPAAPAAPPPPAASAAAAAPADPAAHPGAVTSPMVGTVYLQPEPGAASFVKVGDTVEEGQTLLIIEAMKTMNQIPAPHAGTVKRIVIEDGSPVEFGAPLMIVE